jgi:hypothetical protein
MERGLEEEEEGKQCNSCSAKRKEGRREGGKEEKIYPNVVWRNGTVRIIHNAVIEVLECSFFQQ